MTAHAYSEKALVERATMEVLSSLGWTTVSADEEEWHSYRFSGWIPAAAAAA